VGFAARIIATLMGNRAIDPKALARTIHAWDSAFGRHRKAGHPVLVCDVEAALKLLRRAEKALRKCVYLREEGHPGAEGGGQVRLRRLHKAA
jgi:hypothetical protein